MAARRYPGAAVRGTPLVACWLLVVAMFLAKRVIPLGAAGVLALAAVLAIATIPDIKVGFSSTRFEMLAVGIPAIIGAVLAALASLIQTKRLERAY
jgi:hypothetical protein